MDKGENPNARDADGKTPIMQAAAYNQNPQVITVLLGAGADIEARDKFNSMTPLMYAAWVNKNPEMVTVLLNAGANAKARSLVGKTALDFALYNLKLVGTGVYKDLQRASLEAGPIRRDEQLL